MKCVYKIMFILGIIFPIISIHCTKFFRRHYTYFEEVDAFYKIHWDSNGLSWNAAFLACDDEEAAFFYPRVKGEWALVKNLMDKMKGAPNVTEIFVGLHDEFRLGEYLAVDGHSTSSPLSIEDPKNSTEVSGGKCLLMNINTGVYSAIPCRNQLDTPLPFVCRKVDNESCPTVDHGYKYAKFSNKCYKVNNKLKTWVEAMQICHLEGGFLAVLESFEEAHTILKVLDIQIRYHVGVRRMTPDGDYFSVKGQKFEDVFNGDGGIHAYHVNEPTDCISVVKENTRLWTYFTNCDNKQPFICEMSK